VSFEDLYSTCTSRGFAIPYNTVLRYHTIPCHKPACRENNSNPLYLWRRASHNRLPPATPTAPPPIQRFKGLTPPPRRNAPGSHRVARGAVGAAAEREGAAHRRRPGS